MSKNVPAIRFEGVSDEWEIDMFKNIVTRKSSHQNNLKLPKVEFEDVVSGEGRLNKDLNKKKVDERKGILFEKNNILYGKLRPYLNNWSFADFKGIAVGDFWVFETNKYIPLLVYYLIQSEKYQKIANLSTGTKMPRSDWKVVSNTKFSVPKESEEQAQIGNFFQQLDKTISLSQQELAGLKETKQAFLQKMFSKEGEVVPEIRFKDFNEKWQKVKGKKIFKSVSDKNHPELKILSASQREGMVFRSDNGINITHNENNTDTYKRVVPGQFVMHLRSFQGGFAYSTIEGITSPAYTIIDFINADDHNEYFWSEIFKSVNFIKLLEKVTYGIRDGRSISFKDFSSLKLIFPSLQEQTAIGNFFKQLDEAIALQEKEIELLKETKQAFLQKMFI